MAAKAYVLIETQVGKSNKVVEAIRGLEGVESVDVVTGPYDVIATVEGVDLSAIGDVVTNKFHPISGISRTVTCITVGSS
jgi:DNA-binding Lrp family transcriptional regulator